MRTAKIANAKTLGNVLRSARIARGLNQRALADELDMSQRAVIDIERGRTTKATERLFDYMRETGVTLYAEVADD